MEALDVLLILTWDGNLRLGLIGKKKWAGPVIYRTLARLEGKKGAARWEPGDAPNDVLRVGARVAYWHRQRDRHRQGGIVLTRVIKT